MPRSFISPAEIRDYLAALDYRREEMARITAEEKKQTPIYFQTRRESKYTIPNIALPPVWEGLDTLLEPVHIPVTWVCLKCNREKGCNADCEDMNCDHCYCDREGRDG